MDKSESRLHYRPAGQTLRKRTSEYANKIFHYVLLISLSFVFMYPILYLISRSMMQPADLADATVVWIPKELSFSNFINVFAELKYMETFIRSVMNSLVPALIQTFTCAIVGYGFARYTFPGRGILLALVLFTFLVPPQTIVVPLFILFNQFDWINSYLAFWIPAILCQGLRGSLFVLIYIQFFRGLPGQLEEAARIDGANAFRTFSRIMFPLARPAMLVVFLFSLVWHWNDMFQPGLFILDTTKFNLTQQLSVIYGQGEQELTLGMGGSSAGMIGVVPSQGSRIMAGALLTILPMLILYLFTQRYFVESVERAGIAGE